VALGVVSDTPFESEEVCLEVGDRLVLYTDGITEAENALEEEYGEARLTAFLDAHRADADRALLDGLVGNVLLFGGGVKPRDDMTLMVLGRR
jgi:serine phosphatase RsbU (regulator of sigma subunit)